MKVLPWLCGLSLAANAALVSYTATRGDTPAASASSPATKPMSVAASVAKPLSPLPASPADDAKPFVRTDTALGKLLDGSDLQAMRDALEASGLTADDAKAILRTRIRDRQKAAREVIDKRASPQDSVWWYQDEKARNEFEEKRRADRKVLNDEITQTLATLFGPEPKNAAEGPSIHNQAKFLPEAKRLAVSQILQDYEAMEREGRPKNSYGYGPELASDQEKRRFIAEERRKDLAAVLSPEELRDYDMRYSQTAQNIRWQLAGMKPSLDEYEAIFEARRDLDTRFDTSGSGERPSDFWQKRQEAETAALATLRAKLGEDRFIDYALSNDYGSRQVDVAAERYGLPKDTTRQLWKLRQEAGREGKTIHEDQKLSRDEKRALLTELAQRSREQAGRYLNPDAFADLKGNNYISWIDSLEKGNVTIYNELGNGSSGYGL